MSDLELAGVRKTFGQAVALANFDLHLSSGEFVSLLGPSGCGKTTALRIVAGFETPDAGVVRVGGHEMSDLPPNKRNMGMVFQAYSLFPNLSAVENVAFGLRMRKQSADQRNKRAREMLDLVGLSDRMKNYPHQLSGGQQQRVALARALAISPAILLLDEPLSALDAKVRLQLRDEIRRIQRELGITTLFVTHDQEEALAISDRVGVMSQGMIEQIDTPTRVDQNPVSEFVARFVGTMNEIPVIVHGSGAVLVGSTVVSVGATSRPVGSGAALLLRPEHLRLSDDGLAGTVMSQVFNGSQTRLRIQLADTATMVAVDVPTEIASALTAGAVRVAVNGQAAMVADRATVTA